MPTTTFYSALAEIFLDTTHEWTVKMVREINPEEANDLLKGRVQAVKSVSDRTPFLLLPIKNLKHLETLTWSGS